VLTGRRVLDGGGTGNIVTVTAPDVTVRGVIRNHHWKREELLR